MHKLDKLKHLQYKYFASAIGKSNVTRQNYWLLLTTGVIIVWSHDQNTFLTITEHNLAIWLALTQNEESIADGASARFKQFYFQIVSLLLFLTLLL